MLTKPENVAVACTALNRLCEHPKNAYERLMKISL